jgi:hypothetical protein
VMLLSASFRRSARRGALVMLLAGTACAGDDATAVLGVARSVTAPPASVADGDYVSLDASVELRQFRNGQLTETRKGSGRLGATVKGRQANGKGGARFGNETVELTLPVYRNLREARPERASHRDSTGALWTISATYVPAAGLSRRELSRDGVPVAISVFRYARDGGLLLDATIQRFQEGRLVSEMVVQATSWVADASGASPAVVAAFTDRLALTPALWKAAPGWRRDLGFGAPAALPVTYASDDEESPCFWLFLIIIGEAATVVPCLATGNPLCLLELAHLMYNLETWKRDCAPQQPE